jgi:L-ribulokinase
LGTRPEDIYRALIEATAYGTRVIIEAFEQSGVAVKEIVACGGLPERNKLLMQTYADVTGRDIGVARTAQSGSVGSAMFAAVAAGSEAGGYDTILEAAQHMAGLQDVIYRPIPSHEEVYDQLYAQYLRLHDHFGRGGSDVMKVLKSISTRARSSR